MKKVFLFGGLGNMLFQLNYAYRLFDASHDVELNVSLGQSNIFTRHFLKWSIHNSFDTILQMNLVDNFDISYRLDFSTLFSLAFSKSSLSKFSNVVWLGHSTPEISHNLYQSNYSPVGYFHFNNPTSLILRQKISDFVDTYILNHKNSDLSRVIDTINSNSDSILAHVRGGDFLDQNVSSTSNLQFEYYSRALKGYQNVYVVSNDYSYAKELLSPIKSNLIPVNSSSVIDDFALILKAKAKVLSNSTFSWWASECGNPCDKVFEPTKFYKHLDWLPSTVHQNRIRI